MTAPLPAAQHYARHFLACNAWQRIGWCCPTCDHLAARLRHEADLELSAEEREKAGTR